MSPLPPPPAKPVLALHQLSLYNTGRMTHQQVIEAFAARRPVLDRILADLAAEAATSRAQHHLIIGQRGMGKTMLLARLAAELRTAPALSSRFIPLVFAEEQYAVDRLSKFWLNCLDSLADARELAQDTAAVAAIDATVKRLTDASLRSPRDDQPFADEVFAAFAEAASATGLRPVLLVDNLQLVFERIDARQQHSLRELLMRPGAPVLIGASPTPPPQTQDYAAAFYDHFKNHYLRPLDETEMRDLLVSLADASGRADVRQRVVGHPARLKVLRQLTGGNPRTTVTLFFLYAEDFAPSVFGDLEGLLDRVTPLYKARFEELTPQQQVIASAVANHWDPITAATLAQRAALPAGTISAQLDRLEKTGVIERVELFDEASYGYQIAERFFNIWFLMRNASRRQRREIEFLTRFLESFYEAPDRTRIARHLLDEDRFSTDRYLWSCAVAASVNDPELAAELTRHGHLSALRESDPAVRRRLEELIDFKTLPPSTLSFAELREKIIRRVPPNPHVTPEEFADLVLGHPMLFRHSIRDSFADSKEILQEDELTRKIELLSGYTDRLGELFTPGAVAWFSKRLSSGQLSDPADWDGWNRTLSQASTAEQVGIAVDFMWTSGPHLTAANLEKIHRILAPSPDADVDAWLSWANLLRFNIGDPEAAERALKIAINKSSSEDGRAWTNLGELLEDIPSRHVEAEAAFREAVARKPQDFTNWYSLTSFLAHTAQNYLRADEAYRAARKSKPDQHMLAIWHADLLARHLNKKNEALEIIQELTHIASLETFEWESLAAILTDPLARYDEAEAALLKATADDSEARAFTWNDLGNLYCDFLNRPADAEAAFAKATALDPTDEESINNRIFLHRDFLGEGSAARPLLQNLPSLTKSESPELVEIQTALFAAYDANWGLAREGLARALDDAQNEIASWNTDHWLRTSAVLLHLNYGAELIAFLDERGENSRLRPWVEALRAAQLGDRRALQNIAPEVRITAEIFFDGIERRLKQLPAKTRRRPVPKVSKRRGGAQAARKG